ncbi:MAG: nickel-dependent hydrogenase large subunit, partial [Thermodesulfovibrionia bacterium]|nr:nickel-dependent hydrogenase large subunit [Thermodesulfovibrionia bacterium]
AHYLEALDWQRDVIKIQALLGAKNPHAQTYIVGGMSIPVDPDSQNALNAGSIAFIRGLASKAKDFVEKVYIPDILAIAPFYLDWAGYGAGVGNFLSYGQFPNDTISNTENTYLPRGIILNKDLSKVHTVDHKKVTEYVTHSWYEYSDGNNKAKHPWDGETNYKYTGPKPPYKFLNTDAKYSWLKAPRYDNKAMEVGPLARMLVAYGSGHKRVQEVVNSVLKTLGVGPAALFSTLGRVAARGIETLVTAEQIPVWLDQLAANMKKGDLKIHSGEKWDPSEWPSEAQGYGLYEAPRGSLGHWVKIKNKKIENYQIVVPGTWNGSPRDARNQRGPYEQALIGTPVADIEQPVEILRTVHSFDPCMACAVHVVDTNGNEVTRIKVV